MEQTTKRVEILDSTLRDGAQGEGISFSVEDKLAITRRLDKLGVPYVEAGNPGSNPKDLEFFRRAAAMNLQHTQLVAFGSTRRKNIAVEEDANVQALLTADTAAVSLFGKCWDLHVRDILGTTEEENFAMIGDTVAFLREHGRRVIFDGEHFFDGYQANPAFAMEALASLRGSQVHSSVILSSVDEGMFKRLGMNVTFEPVYQSHTLYHK